ncbi:MAG: ribose 5-phosphate isomerase [Micromonosporaceae bacterium]|jgi:ribose 5-phosphate isomerase B|nr:ribose 5-phosphate isomerase [Micromonosporaceae bacterium]
MRVYLGSDHAGFELKQDLVRRLSAADQDVIDVGAASYDPEDDYPGYCIDAATRVVADPGSLGVVIGGSGNGEQIAANKVIGVRAALAWSEETARLSREHNDANVLAIGARMHTVEQAEAIVTLFLRTPFSQAERHARRIAQVAEYEVTRALPPN